MDILCNLCGGPMCHEITTGTGKWKSDVPCGLYRAKVTGGYQSYHLFDITTYNFSFCELCLRKLFIQCKIKPEITSDYHQNNTWEDDQNDYEYRLWKDNGGYHQAYLDRKCNAVKSCPNDAVYTVLHNRTDVTEQALCEEHKDHVDLNSSAAPFIPNNLKIIR